MTDKKVKTLKGLVVQISGDKTVKVRINGTKIDKRFKKIVKITNHYLAHDENKICKIGDDVMIKAVRPLSKNKRWSVMNVVGNDNK